VLEEPLSFWGGVDPSSGRIVDIHHPQRGTTITGTILVLPGGRGSSSSSSVLAEAIRAETAPLAVVLAQPDDILVLGALVARELYGRSCPIVVLDVEGYGAIATGDEMTVDAGDEDVRVVVSRS
jgi:predicted aconitase with swiveling domain